MRTQVRDIDTRLNNLYEALETGAFSSEELAPRIKILQQKREELESKAHDLEIALQQQVFELPDIKTIRAYVKELRELLESSPIFDRRALLKSFIEYIEVNIDRVTFHYTLPMPPKSLIEETVAVLPFIQKSRPCRSKGRTFSASFALSI